MLFYAPASSSIRSPWSEIRSSTSTLHSAHYGSGVMDERTPCPGLHKWLFPYEIKFRRNSLKLQTPSDQLSTLMIFMFSASADTSMPIEALYLASTTPLPQV